MSHYDTATRLFHVRRTLIQMMVDRGYLVTQNLKEETIEDFKSKWQRDWNETRDSLLLLFRKSDDPSDQIFIFFPSDAKVGLKPIKNYVEKMKEQQVFRSILVIQNQLTSFAKTALQEMPSVKYRMEQFLESELLVNITEHNLVPKHIRLTIQEKKDLLARYKMKESQLPRIQFNDPVARYYGLEKGDVVKIIRSSETAGKYVTYRLVS
eukprot:TRINITY_DN1284_c0_g1_i1.p1 TRINITY_DN1284_c0_g1~~TRINITY_DN1284_c0_g1_i1.p1  ORF type:complete len:209 (-),score=45.20 TRINITY_DN1284_c0_g1_i1:14-640(-)